MFNVKEIVDNMCFENETFEDIADGYDCSNPRHIEIIIDKCEKENIECNALKQALQDHYNDKSNVSNEELKQVYEALKNREKNPRGSFDNAGRFYIIDQDLIDYKMPSAKYPYVQMKAARTAKFVKALAEKYKCKSLEALEKVAYSN